MLTGDSSEKPQLKGSELEVSWLKDIKKSDPGILEYDTEEEESTDSKNIKGDWLESYNHHIIRRIITEKDRFTD